MEIPHVMLASTEGDAIDVATFSERYVLYVFPGMSPPEQADPAGWDDIPGARGCTQQSCTYRDLAGAFGALGWQVAGLSAQSTETQAEAVDRLHLSLPLFADPDRALGRVLRLPTFEIEGRIYYKRLTMVVRRSQIIKVFYPVFPADCNAHDVLDWIRASEL